MADELCEDIENGKVGPKVEEKERAKYMAEKYNWEKDHCTNK